MKTAVGSSNLSRMRGLALVAGFTVLAGCGGSDTSPQSAATSTTAASTVATTAPATTRAPATTVAPAPTTTVALPSAAQDAAAAHRVLLQPGDLPGYLGGSANPTPFVKVYATCTGSALMPAGRTGRSAAQGPFVLDETATVRAVQTTAVSSFAVFADNVAAAQAAVASLAKPDVGACVGKALLAEVNGGTSPPGTAANQPSVALPALNLGDESAGVRATVAGKTAVLQYFDLTVVRKGRYLSYLFVVRLGATPAPEAERLRLAALLVSRMP